MKLSCCFKDRSDAVQCVTDIDGFPGVGKLHVREYSDEHGWYWIDLDADEDTDYRAFFAVMLWQTAYFRGKMAGFDKILGR